MRLYLLLNHWEHWQYKYAQKIDQRRLPDYPMNVEKKNNHTNNHKNGLARWNNHTLISVYMCIEVISTVLGKKKICQMQLSEQALTKCSWFTTGQHSGQPLRYILSIRRPWCIFQTQPGGLGVYLTPAVYQGPVYIKQRFLFIVFDKKCIWLLYLQLIIP